MTATLPSSYEQVLARTRQTSRSQVTDGFWQFSFQAMNTHCRVNFYTASAALARSYQEEALRWVAWFEAQYSRFIPDSLISRINAAAGEHWVETDPETDAILALCGEMVFFSRSVFDPTSLPLMRLWNWKLTPPVVPTEAVVAAARELVGWHKVQRRPGGVFLSRPGMCLDLGGIGKEYAVDRVLTMGLQRGITNLLVDFGQDVRVQGQPAGRRSWHIGLEDPGQPGKCWIGLAVNQHAVATSGDYVRNFTVDGRRYGHIIDPRDGYPVNNSCLAVSVVAPHCTLAGILSTSAFILGPREGMNVIEACPGVEGAIVTEKGRVYSRNFHTYATE